MNKLYSEYKAIWHVKNHSRHLKPIKKILKSYLKGYKYKYDNIGNIFIGDFTAKKPCLVAHLDSVFSESPKGIKLKRGKLTSKTGLGADDKAGIIAILEILKTNKNINAIFTIDEEIGGIGARGIKYEQIKNVQYFIEIDRQGKNDFINKIYCDAIANDDFIKDIKHLIKKYGFNFKDGAYTDILDLSETSNISAINLSSGYYNPHTSKEYVVLSELQNTINFVKAILKTAQKTYVAPERKYVDDFENINTDYALKDVYDIKGLIELSNYCDYKDFEMLLWKAYDLGINKNNGTNDNPLPLKYNLFKG